MQSETLPFADALRSTRAGYARRSPRRSRRAMRDEAAISPPSACAARLRHASRRNPPPDQPVDSSTPRAWIPIRRLPRVGRRRRAVFAAVRRRSCPSRPASGASKAPDLVTVRGLRRQNVLLGSGAGGSPTRDSRVRRPSVAAALHAPVDCRPTVVHGDRRLVRRTTSLHVNDSRILSQVTTASRATHHIDGVLQLPKFVRLGCRSHRSRSSGRSSSVRSRVAKSDFHVQPPLSLRSSPE